MKDSDPGRENQMRWVPPSPACCLESFLAVVRGHWQTSTIEEIVLRAQGDQGGYILQEKSPREECASQRNYRHLLRKSLKYSAENSSPHACEKPPEARERITERIRGKSTWGSHSTWNNACSHQSDGKPHGRQCRVDRGSCLSMEE